jgi:two-component system, chemotaxis family, response regulator Rcp1
MTRPIQVLLVEDNPGDAHLTREALDGSILRIELSVVTDGVQAMAFLNRRGSFAQAPRPDLILLDLNLPKKDGRQVLADIKSDSALRSIPVIILTSSDAENDMTKSHALGASHYLVKSTDLRSLQGIANFVEQFWYSVVNPASPALPRPGAS